MLVEYTCMGITHVNGQVIALTARAVVLLTALVGSCAASSAGSAPVNAWAEAVPPKTSGYLPLEDPAPNREMMAADEQSKLKQELIAARDRQAASIKAQGGEGHAKPAKRQAAQRTH
jgi:hypothetical protein